MISDLAGVKATVDENGILDCLLGTFITSDGAFAISFSCADSLAEPANGIEDVDNLILFSAGGTTDTGCCSMSACSLVSAV
jgi:hypothetical protein